MGMHSQHIGRLRGKCVFFRLQRAIRKDACLFPPDRIQFNECNLFCRCRCQMQRHCTYEAGKEVWHLIDYLLCKSMVIHRRRVENHVWCCRDGWSRCPWHVLISHEGKCWESHIFCENIHLPVKQLQNMDTVCSSH